MGDQFYIAPNSRSSCTTCKLQLMGVGWKQGNSWELVVENQR